MRYRIYFVVKSSTRNPIRDFLRALPVKHRIKCIDYLKRVREHGTRTPKNIATHLEDGLWEARPEYGGIEYRFLHFFGPSDRIGVVAAFVKKRQRVQRRVIGNALDVAEHMRSAWEEESNG